MSRSANRPLRFAALLLALGAATSCASNYRNLDYAPQPAMAIVQPVGATNAIARVLMTVQGVGYHKEEGYRLELRMRIENRGTEPIDLFAAELLLVDRTLQPFGTPRILDSAGNPTSPTVPGSGVKTFDLVFPFPPNEDDLDLDTLNLKWGLLHPGGEEVLSTTFERLIGYADSGWRVSPSFSIGIGFD